MHVSSPFLCLSNQQPQARPSQPSQHAKPSDLNHASLIRSTSHDRGPAKRAKRCTASSSRTHARIVGIMH
jgi:hypothetical protein